MPMKGIATFLSRCYNFHLSLTLKLNKHQSKRGDFQLVFYT